MKLSPSTAFALRSLWRNPRRTILSAVGIAVGVAIAMVISGTMAGGMAQFFDIAAEGGIGHVRVVPEGWLARRDSDLRLADPAAELAAARALGGVRVAGLRTRTPALVALGNRIVGVELLGVDPDVEPALNRFVRAPNVAAGSYLAGNDNGAAVVGRTIAERLDAEVGDRLMVTVAGRGGEMESAMLSVKGIVDLGNDEIEGGIFHVMRHTVERLTGIPGAGEVAILVDGANRVDEIARALASDVSGADRVITWADILPGVGMTAQSKSGYTAMFTIVCIVVVMLGIVSAQITAVLERRREFGMLTAIGMKSRHVLKMLFVEAVVLGLAGGVLGLALGMPGLYYLAVHGFDPAVIYGEVDIVFAGVWLDTSYYADMGLWVVPTAFAVGLGSTILATAYPALLIHRLDPAEAMRLSQ
jgi:ABC-type lipoprotein release transport system permease subunit